MGCKLPTVKKFLCCFKLETGGLFVGWFTSILFGLSAFLLTGNLIIEVIKSNTGSTCK